MKALVTGGLGFIGSHLVDALLEQGHKVAVVDNLSTGSMHNRHPKVRHLYLADVAGHELQYAFTEFSPDVVYHLAAQVSVAKSLQEPLVDAAWNVLGTVNLLEHCKRNNVRKLIYASSAAIYGTPKQLPITEEHPIEPLSCYGISKYTPELYIKTYASLHGLNYTIFRYANVYGSRQPFEGEGAVIPVFINSLIEGVSPNINGDGEQTRDFIYVKDVADACILAAEKADGATLNLSTNAPVTINELFDILRSIAGSDIAPNHNAPRVGDIKDSYLDNAKLKQVLGFAPKYTLKQGLTEAYEYYKQQTGSAE